MANPKQNKKIVDFGRLIEEEYARACERPSDINEHLPVLRELAESVDSVVEFGARKGVSTRAFLAADVRLRSYDLELDDDLQKLFISAQTAGKDAEYLQGNTLSLTIEPTDFLFIDTLHSYKQLSAELNRHAAFITRFIAFHDTVSFGLSDETFSDTASEMPGIHNFYFAWPLKKIKRTIKKYQLNKHTSSSNPAGILNALIHFLAHHSGEWRIKEHRTNNNGLTVIERISHPPASAAAN